MCSGKEGIINRNNVCILIKLTFMATYFGWCISEPSSGNKIQKENRTCVIYFCFKRSQLGAHYFLVYLFQLLYVSGNYVPTVWRTYCIYATLVFFTLSGLQTRQPPIQSEKYQCRIDTVRSPDGGHIVA